MGPPDVTEPGSRDGFADGPALSQRLDQVAHAAAAEGNPDAERAELGATFLEFAQDGHILGYRALVDPASLGLGLQAFVGAVLNHHSTASIESFEGGLVDLQDVRACYHVAGRFDYLLHVAVRDLEHLGQLIKHDIAAIPGVDKVETMLVFSEVKPDAGWPVETEDEE